MSDPKTAEQINRPQVGSVEIRRKIGGIIIPEHPPKGWKEQLDQLRADNARLTIERDEAKAATDFANLACDRKDATLATYKAAVVESRAALESVMRFTRGKYWHTYPNVESVCTDALHTLSALTGDTTTNPLKSPSL